MALTLCVSFSFVVAVLSFRRFAVAVSPPHFKKLAREKFKV